MGVTIRFDLKHWMVGFTFDRYNFLLSIGPVSIIFANYKKYQREMERHILQNGGHM